MQGGNVTVSFPIFFLFVSILFYLTRKKKTLFYKSVLSKTGSSIIIPTHKHKLDMDIKDT